MNGKELHELLGAYVLGGLDDADRARFEDHLQRCAVCRDDLAELETLPASLGAVPVPDAVALAVPAPRVPGASRIRPPSSRNLFWTSWRPAAVLPDGG